MSTESVLRAYVAELETAARLDRAYYLNPEPSAADRTAYNRRKERIEALRQRVYSDLAAVRKTRDIAGIRKR